MRTLLTYHRAIYLTIKTQLQAERRNALSKLSATQDDLNALGKELTQYGACDPAIVEEKKRAVILAKEAAIRWTGKGNATKTSFRVP